MACQSIGAAGCNARSSVRRRAPSCSGRPAVSPRADGCAVTSRQEGASAKCCGAGELERRRRRVCHGAWSVRWWWLTAGWARRSVAAGREDGGVPRSARVSLRWKGAVQRWSPHLWMTRSLEAGALAGAPPNAPQYRSPAIAVARCAALPSATPHSRARPLLPQCGASEVHWGFTDLICPRRCDTACQD